ncbi:MAG: HEAT repeat domain-containing protein [Deltaproteobacteria bacterium]|nr:HEAT repeat domain-containing protein [Deltaproteobacteria bacterium]
MGGIVLPLMSTRRQDYEMCHYNLIKHFPAFLRAYPLVAAKVIIEILNIYIIGRHVIRYLKEDKRLEDIVKKFSFRGKNANYLEDGSHIWDEAGYIDEPIKMANELYKYISEILKTEPYLDQLDLMLDVFRDNVYASFFWKRFLELGSKTPKVFAPKLFELCISRHVQTGLDTIHSLGKFIEAAVVELKDEQIKEIEISFIRIPESEENLKRLEYLQHLRNRLLARIPKELLQTEEGKIIRKQMEEERDIPPNRPVVTFTTGSRKYTTEDWLEEKGVDVSLKVNKEILEISEHLNKFSEEWVNNLPNNEDITNILPYAQRIYTKLQKRPPADENVIEVAWTSLASCVQTMSRGVKNPKSDEFLFTRKVLLFCADHESPKADPEYDSKYESPHWSPAPRNEAAQGLPWLAIRSVDPEVLKAIEKLTKDEVPSVRYLIARELFRIHKNASVEFWHLAKESAAKEQNKVVRDALCHSLSYLIGREEAKVTEVLEILVSNILSEKDPKLSESVVSLIMWLMLVRKNEWSIRVSNILLDKPVIFSESLRKATFEALKSVTPQAFYSDDKKEIAESALNWLGKAVSSAAEGIRILIKDHKDDGNEETQNNFSEVYSVIDEIITRLYFSSEQSEEENNERESIDFDELLSNYYFKIKPLLKQILKFAINKYNGVMFASTAHHFMELLNKVIKYDPKGVLHLAARVAESSEATNYNLDSLAIREVIKLVEAILADHRIEVRDGEPLEDLLTLLDMFAKAGWPEALQLVFRLDEVFR